MAIRYTCDWCGKDITNKVPFNQETVLEAKAYGATRQLNLNIGVYRPDDGLTADIHWPCLAEALTSVTLDIQRKNQP